MHACRRFLSLATLTTLAGACAPELNFPPPPDVDPVLAAFENPTARVTSQIMNDFDEVIVDIHDQVEDSALANELVNVVVLVQQELDSATNADTGELQLGPVSFSGPSGGLDIRYICGGWEDPQPDPPDPANGVVDLAARLIGGRLGPLVWGTLDNCRFPVTVAGRQFNVSYDGEMGLFFGLRDQRVIERGQNLYRLPITFISSGTLAVDDRMVGIDEAFRTEYAVSDDGDIDLVRISILIRLNDATTFVYFFDTEGQGIQDADSPGGQVIAGCNIEERRCGELSW